MNEILFDVLRMILMAAVILVTGYVIPYLKELAEKSRYAQIVEWVNMAVHTAEQTITKDKSGKEKKEIVMEFIQRLLMEKNVVLSEEQLHTLIESAVFAMNGGRTG